jgi:ATP-dependent Clp protease adapter protein ClpS
MSVSWPAGQIRRFRKRFREMWAPPKGDGEAAESVSTLANVEGEKAGGVAASSGEEVGPMGSAVGPAAAPSAATWRNIETNSVLWLGVSGSRRNPPLLAGIFFLSVRGKPATTPTKRNYGDVTHSPMLLALLSAFLAVASGFTVAAPGSLPSAGCALPRAVPLHMQTLIPDAPTITKEPALPDSWEVPDTFSFPRRQSAEPPFYKLTLFKSTKHDAKFIAQQLMNVCGFDEIRAGEIARQAQSLGFAVVGEWVQEVAEMYTEGLQSHNLVVDISPVK